MPRLIYYEGRKHFFTPVMLVLFLLFSVINGLKIYSVYQQSSVFSSQNQPEFKEAYALFYPTVSGEITFEKVRDLCAIYNPIKNVADQRMASTDKDDSSYTYNVYSDELFFRWCFLNELEYDYNYKAYAKNIVSKASANISFYEAVKNEYGANENYEIASAFYQREVSNFYNTECYQYLFYYDFSSLLIILLVIYGCSSVFVKEQETQMNMIIGTCTNGSVKTFLSKWIATGLFLMVLCILFSLEDYAFFAALFQNLDARGEPLYALEGFKNTILNLTIDQSFLLFAGTRFLGMLVLAAFFVLLSAAIKRMLPVFIVSFGLVAGAIILQSKIVNGMRLFNPISLVSSRTIYLNAEFINVAGYPVRIYYVSVVAAVIYTSVAIAVSYRSWRKK